MIKIKGITKGMDSAGNIWINPNKVDIIEPTTDTSNAIRINSNYIGGISHEDVNRILNYHLAQNREEQIKTVLDD
jgi:hypothetical protein